MFNKHKNNQQHNTKLDIVAEIPIATTLEIASIPISVRDLHSRQRPQNEAYDILKVDNTTINSKDEEDKDFI